MEPRRSDAQHTAGARREHAGRPRGGCVVQQSFDEHLAVATLARRELPGLVRRIGAEIVERLERGGKVLSCGNGGSAADAQHFTAELVGRFETQRGALPALALTTDTSILTAVGNDFGYDQIFVRQIQALARPGDVVLGLSTSGSSVNVAAALELARRQGCFCVALTGQDGGRVGQASDICLRVPSARSSRVQEIHGLVLHSLAGAIEGAMSARRASDSSRR